jgi:[CysO sulfur-carrier protein]-S-L-cysteine hydrolase
MLPTGMIKRGISFIMYGTEALHLTSAVRAEIIAHAREGKPEEICGLLRGRNNHAREVVRARNTADDRIDNYDVDPQTLLLQFKFEEAGDRMVAIYHSHPVSEAFPSATDAWNAHYPDTYYLICSLENDGAPVLRAFRLLPDFIEFDMDELRQALRFYETRPGLFGYFQPANQPLPPVLQPLAEDEIDPPFYIVYKANDKGGVDDYRLVTVHEAPVKIAELSESYVD